MAFVPRTELLRLPGSPLRYFGRSQKAESVLKGWRMDVKEFVETMNRVRRSGRDFEAGSREALLEKFGGAADVILRGLTPEETSEPRLFVERMSKRFGRGLLGILEPVMNYAKAGRFPPVDRARTSVESLEKQLGKPKGEEADRVKNPLHDQRIRDEQENYSDEAN